jgi:uncharacterized lipoprotein YajG
MIFFRILIVSISILFFSGCATPSTNTPASTNDVKRFPGTYSMYGRSVQFDDEKKYTMLMYSLVGVVID